MILKTAGDIRYYQFETLDPEVVVQAAFTRHGGVSSGPYASLNMSISTGDSRENVAENRRRAFLAVGREPDSVADLCQVHSARVVVADAPRGRREHLGRADALVTDRPEVTLFLRFADCVPLALFDPRRRAVGLVHAGWRGTLAKVAAEAVRTLVERYDSDPADIIAAIGPSIGPCHYAVGADVVTQTRAVFDDDADELLISRNGHDGYHLDLWAANARILRQAGVKQIEVARLCTVCRNTEFFSHRAEGGVTGRCGVLIGLRG